MENTHMTDNALRIDDDLRNSLLKGYEWFHRHPEPSYGEFATTERIRGILQEHGIEILDSGLKTGLVAVVRGTRGDGPVIALRGDIDGLPVTEATGLPYASENVGFMHACGHDFNLSVALGAAVLLRRNRDAFAGTVKVIFQPAEEGKATATRPTGAVQVIDTGVLDDVRAFFGTHDAAGEVGAIYIREGGISGAVDKFQVTVTGKGAHAAEPNGGVDPITAVTAIVQGLQAVTARNLDPVHPRVLSVTHLEAGSTWNVIPETAFFEGTVRTTNPTDRVAAKDAAVRIIENTAAAYGATADVQWFFGSPSVVNDPHWSETARSVAEGLGLKTGVAIPELGGEDFSYYLDKAPGVFVRVGAGETGAAHGPTFAPDPTGIPAGAEYLANIAVRALEELGESGDPAAR
ncbi:amidohydrolase [Bifidobacterium vespertilionis]|uniref:Amidohydrolase n=1 Tax=Bifidobacterium vespertilionis TaxID=2562524 RepID=A0A5J5E1B3_9BIFI|nr:amidohydrolase [Bifidobacterium vespertilionis]KAA8818820.1 amidohydrolase [Bifidobacterium vespertilionis]KAA8822954.1 amidohydrolase [Bifidobacterium vespertilionis]